MKNTHYLKKFKLNCWPVKLKINILLLWNGDLLMRFPRIAS